MNAFGTKLGTVGIALVSVGTITVASTIQETPRPIPTVQLTAESPPATLMRISPTLALTSPNGVSSPSMGTQTLSAAVQPSAQVSVVESLLNFDLGRFIIPPSAAQPIPAPPTVPAPTPNPTAGGLEDAIINTYHAIEPWVRWGFELAAYAVGWVPYVGWLAPQIMIFYNFGERIVESLVVNSANWLLGPLNFVDALGNVARDSWNALVQLGIDQWNFWLPSLPPLPPLPFAAQEPSPKQVEPVDTLASVDEQMTSLAANSDPLGNPLSARRQLLTDPERIAREDISAQEFSDPGLAVGENVENVEGVEGAAAQDDDGQPVVGQEGAASHVDEPGVVEVQADLTVKDPAQVKTSELARTQADTTSGPETARVTPTKKKPFGKKPNSTTAASTPSTSTPEESSEASDAKTTNTDVGKPTRPKKRADHANRHQSTEVSSDANSAPAA